MGCRRSPTGQRDGECGQRMLVRASKAGFGGGGNRERHSERQRERDIQRDTQRDRDPCEKNKMNWKVMEGNVLGRETSETKGRKSEELGAHSGGTHRVRTWWGGLSEK